MIVTQHEGSYNTLERPGGLHSLAAAVQRERSLSSFED
jgi:hypothetical protein